MRTCGGEYLERGEIAALDAEYEAGAGEGRLPGYPEMPALEAIRRGGGHLYPSRRRMYAPKPRLSTGPEFRKVVL
jgi:hypothetical protein